MAALLSVLVRTTLNTSLRKPPWHNLCISKFISGPFVYPLLLINPGSIRFKSTQKLTSEKDDSLHQQSLRNNKIWNENYERIKEYVKNIATKDAKPLTSSLNKWLHRERSSKRKKDQGVPSTLTDDQEEKLESLGLFTGVLKDVIWKKRYEELVEYRKEHGHFMVPTESQTHEELGIWVNNQRHRYKKSIQGKLPRGTGISNERISLLNKLDFVWDPFEDLWKKRYEELVEYYKEHGHSRVPSTGQTHIELGFWVRNQREMYKEKLQNKPGGSRMTDARIRLLNELDFVWDIHEDLWTKRYEELVEYYKERGHSMVSHNHKKLGKWVVQQRVMYKRIIQGKPGGSQLTDARIRLLNELDFVWDYLENDWFKRYEELVEYYKQHGHTMVSQTHKELRSWVINQRVIYKRNIQGKPGGSRMTDERIRLLNELDFVWDALEDQWNKQYEELVEYYKEHGHSMVSKGCLNYKELYTWVLNQRQLYRQKTQVKLPKGRGISNERIRLLNELDFVWDTREVHWRTRYQKLVEYTKQHGRGTFIKDKKLFRWLALQRKQFLKWEDGQKSTMTKQRVELLEKVGYTFDDDL
jgi:hypothetical protein